jgi:hypothetical protein
VSGLGQSGDAKPALQNAICCGDLTETDSKGQRNLATNLASHSLFMNQTGQRSPPRALPPLDPDAQSKDPA